MDSNKDDALKCLKIDEDALDSGNHARALKFLTTAQESEPNPTPNETINIGSSSSSSSSSSTARSRFRVSMAASKDYIEEQLTTVQTIKKRKDYYQILGFEKSCSVDDMQKVYRKLSLSSTCPNKNEEVIGTWDDHDYGLNDAWKKFGGMEKIQL